MIAREYPFTAAESQDIETALRTYHSSIAARTDKVWFKHVDVSRVLNLILAGEVNAAIVDGAFLVIYDTGTPWYSEDVLVLEEMLALRVAPGGDFRAIPQFLEAKARFHGCAMVCVGTALAPNDRALARMYERHGYAVNAVQLSKPLR